MKKDQSEVKKRKEFSKAYQKMLLRLDIVDVISNVAICFVVAFFISNFVLKPIIVQGDSMYPTFSDGDIGFSSVVSAKLFPINRNEVAIIYIAETNDYVIKRIIGLPLETIEVKDGVLYINNQETKESYLDDVYKSSQQIALNNYFTNDFGPITLDKNEYFVMGDNRPFSADSREYGPIKKDQIVATNQLIIYPFKNFKLIIE